MRSTQSLTVSLTILGVIFCSMDPIVAVEKSPPKVSAKESFRPDAINKLAVIVTGPQKSSMFYGHPQTDQQRQVEDQFLGTLIEKNYDIAVRSDLDRIVGEQQLQKSGLTDSDSAEIGRLLNVPAVMLIHITDTSAGGSAGMLRNRSGSTSVNLATAALGARLIDVKTGSVLWTGTHRVEVPVSDARSSDALIKVADELAEAFPKRESAARSPETPRPNFPASGQRLTSAFVAGSVWEGTQTRIGEDANPINVKWIVKERDGEKFRAEYVLPMTTISIEGTVSGGIITWRGKAAEGREHTVRIRGRAITGKISRPRPGGNVIETNLFLTLKSDQ